jgi:Na+-transporting methylmalonyl-CoA/oxaloacetate decarboxylase gamma subunit
MRRLGLALAVLALAGCGGGGGKDIAKEAAEPTPTPTATPKAKPTNLNTAKVARAITVSIAKQRKIKAKVVCPSGVPQQEGLKFACLAIYKGGTTTFTVDQTDGKGNVKYVGQ